VNGYFEEGLAEFMNSKSLVEGFRVSRVVSIIFGEILVELGFVENGQFWSPRVLSGRIVGLGLL
jgi:hypothetical protein